MSFGGQAPRGAFADLYDFGESTSASEEKLGPVWSLEPDENYSDWTIVVANANDKTQKKTYHVHRSILCLGPRKSHYFGAICRGDSQFQEANSSTTELTFPDSACKHFDLLLDFMYGWVVRDSDYLDRASADELTVLRYLARYLTIPILFNRTTLQIIPLLSYSEDPAYIDTLTTLMSSGDRLGDDSLVCRATDTFALSLFDFCRDLDFRDMKNLNALKNLTSNFVLSLFEAKRLDMIVYAYTFGQLGWKSEEMAEPPDETFLKQMREAKQRGYMLAPFLINLLMELGVEDSFKQIRDRCLQLCGEAEIDCLERDLRQLARLGHLAKTSRLRSDLSSGALFNLSHIDFQANFKFMVASDKIRLVEAMIKRIQEHSDSQDKALEEWCKKDYSAMDNSTKLETLDQYIRWRLLEVRLP